MRVLEELAMARATARRLYGRSESQQLVLRLLRDSLRREHARAGALRQLLRTLLGERLRTVVLVGGAEGPRAVAGVAGVLCAAGLEGDVSVVRLGGDAGSPATVACACRTARQAQLLCRLIPTARVGSGALRRLLALAATLKTIVVAGVGFFTDSYDLFVMNLLNVVFKEKYGKANYPSERISTAALVGAIVGQLTFGFVADAVGRRIGMIITTLLLITGAILSGVGYWGGTTTGLFWALTVYRFILGVGIGGEYPCAATVAAEGSDVETREAIRHRGRTVLLVFSMQGVGNLAATLAVLILVVALTERRLEAVWRTAFLIGAIPVLAVLYSRCRIKNSKLFEEKKRAAQHRREHPDPLANIGEPKHESKGASIRVMLRLYKWRILSVALTWFLWDIVYYSNGLFSSSIIQEMAKNGGIKETALCQLLLVVVALPGYYVAAFIVDKSWCGRKRLQFWGFIVTGLLHCLVGGLYSVLKKNIGAFVALYALVFFSYQCGPNSSTFLIPAEIFPTAIRARAHGFSAACGKTGAAVGAVAMLPLINAFGGLHSTKGPMVAFFICGGLSLITAPLTLLVPEMSNKALATEDEAYRAMTREMELEDRATGKAHLSPFTMSPCETPMAVTPTTLTPCDSPVVTPSASPYLGATLSMPRPPHADLSESSQAPLRNRDDSVVSLSLSVAPEATSLAAAVAAAQADKEMMRSSSPMPETLGRGVAPLDHEHVAAAAGLRSSAHLEPFAAVTATGAAAAAAAAAAPERKAGEQGEQGEQPKP
eukprot:m51a1_g9895 hypothetical protein (771) ;mRNA; f:54527-57971